MKNFCLGVDLGSVSTDMVLIDESKNVYKKVYLRTFGKPVDSVHRGLKELFRGEKDICVIGAGATGSGRKIAAQMMVDSASVASALCDSAFLASYGFTPENVFAMILPDTYQMYWTASISQIFDRFKKEYDLFWTEERVQKAADQKLTPMQVSVMASIVSGETLKTFEYPKIAGVYLNRYHKGMKLQADPTVCFCHDYKLDRVLKKHLTIDSPYNTYKYKGLPPAPINVPPKACLEAVLNPDSHGYIYFCASPDFDGTHRFAVTYSEHMKNAREFQRELTRRRREKAKLS